MIVGDCGSDCGWKTRVWRNLLMWQHGPAFGSPGMK